MQKPVIHHSSQHNCLESNKLIFSSLSSFKLINFLTIYIILIVDNVS